MRVIEPGRDPDLLQEPLGPDGRGQLVAHHLDSDLPIVLRVLGQVDGGHAARTDLALDRIAFRQRPLHPIQIVSHEPLFPPTHDDRRLSSEITSVSRSASRSS